MMKFWVLLGLVLWMMRPAQAQVQRARQAIQDANEATQRAVEQTTGDGLTFAGDGKPNSSRPAVEFRPGGNLGSPTLVTGPSGIPPEALAKWHIRNNVCNGNLLASELILLFPEISPTLIRQTCGG